MTDLFPEFEKKMIDVGEAIIHARIGGEGPPLLMLHGYPESHATWSKIAPMLKEHFTLIIPDLRGYGESSVPEPDTDHMAYSKRAMARDMAALMAALGHERFHLLGHDRGGRVSYRLALDAPERLISLCIIDVVPTYEMWERWNAALSLKAYHWSFLAQPHPLPEKMIAADSEHYFKWTLASWTHDKTLAGFDPDALAHYLKAASDPARIRAFCEDYRAGATVDRAIDLEDKEAGKRIRAPMHYLYTSHNFAAASAKDPTETWQRWANDISASMVVAGHFPQEEASHETAEKLLAFFLQHR